MTFTANSERLVYSISEVAPNAPTTSDLRQTFNTDSLFVPVRSDIFAQMPTDFIGPKRPYFDRFVSPYLPPNVYEDFLASANNHRTFIHTDIDFEYFLHHFETNNREVGRFSSLNTARVEFISGVYNAFVAGKWQSFLEPNFLRQLTEHMPKCIIESGESYQPDLILTDFLATLRLLSSKVFIGTPEEKQYFTTEGFNVESVAVLNHWVPNTEAAAQHIGQLTLNYLQSQDLNNVISTLNSLTDPEQLKDAQTHRNLISARYCLNVINTLLSSNSPVNESVQANNAEVIRQSWPLIDSNRRSLVTEALLTEGKQGLQSWLNLLRQDLSTFMPQVISSWNEVGQLIDPKPTSEEIGEYYQSLIEEHRRAWDQDQLTLIDFIQTDETVDQEVLLGRISVLLGTELSCLTGSSPSQAVIDHVYSQIFDSKNSESGFMSLTNPLRRILINRSEISESENEGACEEWAYCEGSFKNPFYRNYVEGIYGPINTLTEQQYKQFLKLMRVVSAYYPIILDKQRRAFEQSENNQAVSEEPDSTVTTTTPPEYSTYS